MVLYLHLQIFFDQHRQSTQLALSENKINVLRFVLKAVKHEKQKPVSRIFLLSRQRWYIRYKTWLMFRVFPLAWSTHKPVSIKFLRQEAYQMKPSMLRQNQPWIRIEKQQELPLAKLYLPVANNNLSYNLQHEKKKKEIRPNSHRGFLRIRIKSPFYGKGLVAGVCPMSVLTIIIKAYMVLRNHFFNKRLMWIPKQLLWIVSITR